MDILNRLSQADWIGSNRLQLGVLVSIFSLIFFLVGFSYYSWPATLIFLSVFLLVVASILILKELPEDEYEEEDEDEYEEEEVDKVVQALKNGSNNK